ncbi:hypothetical protein TUBRATIS_009640 [Tubulinosema ratisbonensis]|uniref:Uncharacterized protein n=1 Tax=Tubulinosema ratisbonensis TaxID=291195 RepID=A0A437ANC0_9MICR|nr:hypothetical protein TUBRATIS_009640 [Tubulinosema ratisbonensis]
MNNKTLSFFKFIFVHFFILVVLKNCKCTSAFLKEFSYLNPKKFICNSQPKNFNISLSFLMIKYNLNVTEESLSDFNQTLRLLAEKQNTLKSVFDFITKNSSKAYSYLQIFRLILLKLFVSLIKEYQLHLRSMFWIVFRKNGSDTYVWTSLIDHEFDLTVLINLLAEEFFLESQLKNSRTDILRCKPHSELNNQKFWFKYEKIEDKINKYYRNKKNNLQVVSYFYLKEADNIIHSQNYTDYIPKTRIFLTLLIEKVFQSTEFNLILKICPEFVFLCEVIRFFYLDIHILKKLHFILLFCITKCELTLILLFGDRINFTKLIYVPKFKLKILQTLKQNLLIYLYKLFETTLIYEPMPDYKEYLRMMIYISYSICNDLCLCETKKPEFNPIFKIKEDIEMFKKIYVKKDI